jgi:hypothetical protein
VWILFFILITAPGQYEVHPLETYKSVTAEKECKTAQASISLEFKSTYPQENMKDTYSFVCLKQKEKEA